MGRALPADSFIMDFGSGPGLMTPFKGGGVPVGWALIGGLAKVLGQECLCYQGPPVDEFEHGS